MIDKMKDWLNSQIKVQEEIHAQNLYYIDQAPAGELKVRHRNNQEHIRRVTRDSTKVSGYTEQSITKEELTIAQLIQKEISMEAIKCCESNMKNIERLRDKYLPIDIEAIKRNLPQAHQHLAQSAQELFQGNWASCHYDQRVDVNHMTIHATRKGDWVASKSEVIIANALYENGIPYHYDERSDITTAWDHYYYPDFTMLLPDGRKIYWEHLGMLSNEEYLRKNMQKLLLYHQQGVTIGRNLIISVDDIDGNCDSPAIYNIIETALLPHFA